MRDAFVNTENVKRLNDGLAAVLARGASEACWAIVDGLPGLGKTTATERAAIRMNSAFIRSKTKMSPNWLLADLLESLGVKEHEFSYKKRFDQTIKTLAQHRMAADDRGEHFAIFIDEADAISRHEALMETLRDITDTLEITTVVVGMGKLRSNLGRYPQISRRVSQVITFEPLPLTDVKKVFGAMCDIEVADDLIAQVRDLAKGAVSEVLEGIAAIERFAAINPQKGAITVADMAGHVIMKDRATNTEIRVLEYVA